MPQTSPVEIARAWAGSGGLVFLDSGPAATGGTSIIAAEPEEIVTGHLSRDTERLRHALRRAPASGGLCGSVEFGGRFVFGLYSQCAIYQHQSEDWSALPEKFLQGAPARGPGVQPQAPVDFIPQMDQQEFVRLVRRAQDYISAGDIYQVNLSYPWLARWPSGLEPFDFYERLRLASPAPHAAFLDLDGRQVFSASPECFVKMSGRHILTRPIKGTRPRGADAGSDSRLAEELRQSPKERAELVMITDLERNDLGQVCEFGSVRVSNLLGLESHAQVHHLVSTVEGTLRPGVDHLDAFLACFPGGSISGAPKKRALEIIRELEPHDRGLYTGAIGWFGSNGESQFNIAIRTAWKQGDEVRFDTGAGIVADSIPAHEYEETQHKAAGILNAALG